MARATSKKRKASAGRERGRSREIAGVFLLALAILTTLALASYPGGNILRGFGERLSGSLVPLTFGRWASWVFPLLLFLWSFAVFLRWKKNRIALISLGLLFLAFWMSFVFYLLGAPTPNAETTGWIGLIFGDAICNFMGPAGAWTVWILVVVIGLIALLRFQPSCILAGAFSGMKAGALRLREWYEQRRTAATAEENAQTEWIESPQKKLAGRVDEAGEAAADAEPEESDEEPRPPVEIQRRHPTLPLPFNAASAGAGNTRKQGDYVLPPLTLLLEPPPESPDAPEELRAKAKRLQTALSDFGVGARVIKVNPGPVITRFDLEPDPGVKVSRISALADDLALVLRARAIRIQAPIPGQGAVGIEIPNRHPSTVVLKSVASHPSFQEHPSSLAIALGQTAAGDPYVSDLGRMPHLLVAGTTGSGKSVCLNAIIASLLLRNPPQRLQFVIIDPKKLEMSGYARLARHHLMISPDLDEEVITTPANAVAALGGVELEMGRRYDILAGAGVRNIEEFNRLAARGEAVSGDGEVLQPLSYLIVVIDELADLMMISAKDIEEPIARLAQMARAVGIHLIVATQRPSVDVITGVIKANFPARLAFQVASKVDSRTILDTNGAETLLGNGDALFIPPGRGQPERIHCCYVSPAEIDAIVTHIENQPDDFYRYPLKVPRLEGISGPDGEISGELDEFFNDAVRIVIHQGQASVSILQRRLKIGYARAGRLIDQLERAGIVGPFDGSKAREVLVGEEYLNQIGSGMPTPE
jgi:S-DNA-T family DNA segregation ATPase FtsK/SpoIIIE